MGPWDLTPAGQPISLVDMHQPDLDQFPRFSQAWAQAQVAELNPGDAIYMPGMWWHQVESLSAINGLINYWWSETPTVFGAPMDAFNHALLSIKQLPECPATRLEGAVRCVCFQRGRRKPRPYARKRTGAHGAADL